MMSSPIKSQSICHLTKWAVSAGHRDIELFGSQGLVALSHHRPVLFIGGVHGDEPEGVELAQQTLRLLQTKPTELPWLLIPCLNPDGYLASPRTRMNAHGVDLNRNFPTPDWSPACKGPRYYPGLGPATEPEVIALTQLIQKVKPRAILHFHSDSVACNVYSGENGRSLAEFFTRHNGYPAKPDIGYPTPGSLGQYGLQVINTPVICLEELERIPLSEVWPHYESAMNDFFYQTQIWRNL